MESQIGYRTPFWGDKHAVMNHDSIIGLLYRKGESRRSKIKDVISDTKVQGTHLWDFNFQTECNL